MDSNDGRPVVEDGRVEMRKVHEVQLLFVERVEEGGLFAQGVVGRVGTDFVYAFVRWGKSLELWIVEEEKELVGVVDGEKIAREFVHVAANAGET